MLCALPCSCGTTLKPVCACGMVACECRDRLTAADEYVGGDEGGGGEHQGRWNRRVGALSALPSPGMPRHTTGRNGRALWACCAWRWGILAAMRSAAKIRQTGTGEWEQQYGEKDTRNESWSCWTLLFSAN